MNKQYDAVLLNSPYQKIVGDIDKKGKTKSQAIWPEINVKSFNVLKDGGVMATIHPGSWKFAGNNSAKYLKRLANIYKTNKILYMEFNNYAKGKKTFGANTDYDVIVLKKEKSPEDVNIKTESGLVNNINLNKMKVIPTDKIELFKSMMGDDKIKFISGTFDTRDDDISSSQTEEFRYLCVYSEHEKTGYKFYYSNTKRKGHFGIPKLIISRSSKKSLLDLTGEYGLTQFASAIIDTPENLIEMKKRVDSKAFNRLKEYFVGYSPHVNIVDFNGNMFKFIKEFKKDWWKEFIYD